MLSFNELVSELKQRPVGEQILLLETLTTSLKEHLLSNATKPANSRTERRTIEELFGMLKPDNNKTYSDEELDELRFEALLEKYAK